MDGVNAHGYETDQTAAISVICLDVVAFRSCASPVRTVVVNEIGNPNHKMITS